MNRNAGYRNLATDNRERNRSTFIVYHRNRHIALAVLNNIHLIAQQANNICVSALRYPGLCGNVDPLIILQTLNTDGGRTGADNRIRIVPINFCITD